MEDYVREDEVGEGAFRTDRLELAAIRGVHLKPKTNAEDETADARDESGEEGVEGKRADEAAVHELHHARQQHVRQIRVDDFALLRSRVGIFVEEFRDDAREARGA